MSNRAAAVFLLLIVAISVALVGCELKSADSVVREVGVDFSGYYDGKDDGEFVAPANSGARVTSFNLRQTGDQLEAIDNHQRVYRGTIGEARADGGSANASFTLQGQTTAGQDVTIAGALQGQGSSATITGTWIEPDRYCYLTGDGTINSIPTNVGNYTLSVTIAPSGSGSVSLNPAGGSYASGTSVQLTAAPASGFTFSAWSGDLTGSANPATVTMNSSKNVTATFAGSSTNTNASAGGTGGGSTIIITPPPLP